MMTTLPTDSTARKGYPMFRGLLRYFPAALAGVSRISKLGNDKHNPGEEMHHARGKSNDHADCIIRHLVDLDALVQRYDEGPPEEMISTARQALEEAGNLCWRALALSQELHEKYGAPLAPGAKAPSSAEDTAWGTPAVTPVHPPNGYLGLKPGTVVYQAKVVVSAGRKV